MKNKQTILIVDDVKENIDLLIELLHEHDLVTALNGKTALEIVKEEDIDLILLDIMMPDMDGYEVCSILKKSFKTMHIPVIFLSAKTKHEDLEKGFEVGAVDYITKPFFPNELLARVDTHLKLRAYEKNLEERVNEEVERNRVKQQMIYQQSKQAALGELLMHIAHQWKQPLSSLGSINLLTRAKLDSGISISHDEYLKSIDKSEDLIMFMSQTIDTFKDFYKQSSEDKDFFIHESLLDVLSIVEATFNYDNIKIYVSTNEDKEVFGNVNEFSQVIFSILNNARDIFNLREINNPEINIAIDNAKISISDNGGGVDEDIIKNIFLPNVSKTNGTGIGLYLSKNIILKNNGTISASNNGAGATFYIEF